jgi:hypothetical protein
MNKSHCCVNKKHNIANMVRQRETSEELHKPHLCRLMAFADECCDCILQTWDDVLQN